MTTVSVRYIVDDVEQAISFYTEHLGCTLEMHPGPGFAALQRGDLRLLLNATTGPGGASQPLPDGRRPESGGWNRFQIEVDDLADEVQRMRASGVQFRSEVISGMGGKQVLLDDPSGNPVELFEPA